MATFSNIGLEEPSTVTKSVASVTIDRGSTTEHQEIMTIGGAESSLAIAQVSASSNIASTTYGLVVRPLIPSSQQMANIVSIGTVDAVSSIGGLVSLPSTQQVVVNNISTIVTVAAFGSTAVSTGNVALGQPHVKVMQASPIDSTFVSGNTGSSNESTVAAGVASEHLCVFSIDIGLINPSSQTVRILSGSTTEMWRQVFHSTATANGLTKTVTPPNYLFKSTLGGGLTIASSGGTSSNITYSISYYQMTV